LGSAEGGAEFAGPENGGTKKNKDWKMQDLENDGPNRKAGKYRTWKMTDPGTPKLANNDTVTGYCSHVELSLSSELGL